MAEMLNRMAQVLAADIAVDLGDERQTIAVLSKDGYCHDVIAQYLTFATERARVIRAAEPSFCAHRDLS